MGERKFELDGEAQSLTGNFGTSEAQTIESDELANFLSDNSGSATADPATIVANTPEKEESVKETPDTKPAPKETKSEDATKTLTSFLLDGKEDEEEENEDEEEATTSIVKKTDKEESSKKEENIFKQLAKDLYDLNVFTADDNEPEVNTAEDFLAKFNSEKERQANQYLREFLSQFGEDYATAFQAIYVNGVDPREYFTSYNELQSVKDLDLKDKSNQELVFKEYWRQQGLSEDKITKKLEKAVDFETLEEDATDFHEVLVQREEENLVNMQQRKQAELQQKKAADQAYGQALSQVLSKKLADKEIDGIPLTQKEAEEIFDYMYTKKWKLPNGELLTDQEKEYLELKDPNNIELRIKHALLQKRKYDLSNVVKKQMSKKADSLFSNLAREEKQAKAQFKSTTGSKSFF